MSQGEKIRGLGRREGGAVGEESEGKGENKKRRERGTGVACGAIL